MSFILLVTLYAAVMLFIWYLIRYSRLPADWIAWQEGLSPQGSLCLRILLFGVLIAGLYYAGRGK